MKMGKDLVINGTQWGLEEDYESYEIGSKIKGTNHGVRTGKRGGTYNERTSKNGTSYRQYF